MLPQDMLVEIFRKQREFDSALVEKRALDYDRDTWIQKEILAIIAELSEILEEVNYKWWKDPRPINEDKLKEEIVDVLHFFVSMCIKAGIGPEELYQAYMEKNAENFRRQQGQSDRPGYAWTE
ncbi:MAG TPA: dUTPase [Firmicutes bacterium]|jgi:dimeric dUTPase (all-alpha-NTP-PPase superfamily)|nr:MAG: dUTPase [Peptococcaceae bacterium 1109]HHT72718.1 dUTPase [Bacillota bacterium]